jgi:hypothetical protein
MGSWGSAIVRSVVYVSLFFSVFLIYNLGFPKGNLNVDHILVYLLMLSTFVSIFFIFSIVGWVVVGLPIHWLLCKYGKKNFVYYPVAAFICMTLVISSAGLDAVVIMGFAAILQAIIFRYYVFKGEFKQS